MKIREIFKELAKNDKLNTSYPINKDEWQKYKGEGELEFEGEEICYYVHIPFCLSKCKFCEYVKYTKATPDLEGIYVDILIKDIEKFTNAHKNICLKGLDIGGGTPTCLSDENFRKLLEFIKNLMESTNLSDDFCPSIESTFLSITEEKIKIIAECGFKRISFGLQTVNRKFLKENNRNYPTLKKMKDTLMLCKKHGIEKVNIDLMYGLDGQTKKDLKNSLATIKYFMPKHVTLYELRTNILNIKEYKTKKELFNQYKFLYKNLKKMGYFCNFGQNTFSLDENDLGLSSYIRNRMIENVPYKGFGISAQSKSENGVSYNLGKTDLPLEECLKYDTFSSEDTYFLPKEEMLAKYMAISGYCGRFNLKIMEDIIKENPLERFNIEFAFLLSKKYIKIVKDEVFITKKGFNFYGAILALFYPNRENYI